MCILQGLHLHVLCSVICSYANQMLVIYNIQCKDDERIFFNITHQDIEPKNCTGAGGELVYVSILMEVHKTRDKDVCFCLLLF